MSSVRKVFSMIAILAAGFAIVQCSEDEIVAPSGPEIASGISSMETTFGESTSFNISITAAGKLKEVRVGADSGTVSVTDIIGVAQTTAIAKVNYKAPLPWKAVVTEISDKIRVSVTDEFSQTISEEITVVVTEGLPVTISESTITGNTVWGPGRTIYVQGNVTIAEGASLTVKEGTTVIVSENKGFVVNGNFYSLGTAKNRNTFTVSETLRTDANIFKGLWSGITATGTSAEMVVQYSDLNFSSTQLHFNNPNGVFVMQNSSVAYTKYDGVVIDQGKLLVSHNTFLYNGETGGDAISIKSGSVGEVAFNIFLGAATNAVRWSNAENRTPKTNVNVYNNTVVNSGWREPASNRGGSITLEKGARGLSYSNMIVNSRYGTLFPKTPDNPDVVNSATGNNLYYGNNTESLIGFYPENGSILETDEMVKTDVVGQISENDPKFKAWDVTTFNVESAKLASSATLDLTYDFLLVTGSPALSKGKTGFTTNFTSQIAGGAEYSVPAPAGYIGARGIK